MCKKNFTDIHFIYRVFQNADCWLLHCLYVNFLSKFIFILYFLLSGRIITAAYVPLPNYHSLFADSVRANQLLMPSSQALSASYQTGFMPQMAMPR